MTFRRRSSMTPISWARILAATPHTISTLRRQSKIREAAVYAKPSKIRWAGHVMRQNDHRWTRAVSDWTPRNVKRTTGRPPTRWSDFFTKSFKERYDALRVSPTDRTYWIA
ncbi:hypothetical protein Y032_0113g358 [Ancylostoma ceylanicum]|uniref:Uncharacterized protein n=1 Tax=Ancylostoma ceylanicum TaxID=53326 RepID=A0A016TDH9_9BILA|nr:hypothetical protein Y032_0113g358 [Ancylostoma ceylanicum]